MCRLPPKSGSLQMRGRPMGGRPSFSAEVARSVRIIRWHTYAIDHCAQCSRHASLWRRQGAGRGQFASARHLRRFDRGTCGGTAWFAFDTDLHSTKTDGLCDAFQRYTKTMSYPPCSPAPTSSTSLPSTKSVQMRQCSAIAASVKHAAESHAKEGGSARRKLKRLLKHGVLMDVKVLQQFCKENLPDLTFHVGPSSLSKSPA